MGVARFNLHMRADRPPLLTVNGEEVAGVVGIRLHYVPPSLPQLILELAGEGRIDGEGIVALDHQPDEGDDLRRILGNLDPDKLDEVAAQKFGMDDRQGQVIASPGKAFVEAILDAVEGVH